MPACPGASCVLSSHIGSVSKSILILYLIQFSDRRILRESPSSAASKIRLRALIGGLILPAEDQVEEISVTVPRCDIAAHGRRSPLRWLIRFCRILASRQRVSALLELSDHELNDMGLSNHDVRLVLKLPLSMDPAEALREIARRRGIDL